MRIFVISQASLYDVYVETKEAQILGKILLEDPNFECGTPRLEIPKKNRLYKSSNLQIL